MFASSVRILIVDDNERFLKIVTFMLTELGCRSIDTYTTATEAWDNFLAARQDVCLLDIDLGSDSMNGIELAEKIRTVSETVPIIYLSAYYTEEYYQLCRHTRPSAFLSKELSRFKLQHAIDLALMHPIPGASMQGPGQVMPYATHNHFFFKIGDLYKSIPIDKIAYFFSDQKLNYARVEQRNLPTSVQLKTLEMEFQPGFLRIHKSYLVNVNMIDNINPGESSIVINGETLPIGYAYRKQFFNRLKLLK